MGGMFIDQLMMLDGSEFLGAGMYLEEPYDPSSTFKGFSGDSVGAGKDKEIKGIYARRQEGNDPHHQRIIYAKKLNKKKIT